MADVQLGNRLSEDDEASIVEFLKSLTGQVPKHFSPPVRSNDQKQSDARSTSSE